MAKYAANCSMLHDSIAVLLKRCCLDVDDEVRDRATFYSQLLSCNNPQLITDYLSEPMHVTYKNQIILSNITDLYMYVICK